MTMKYWLYNSRKLINITLIVLLNLYANFSVAETSSVTATQDTVQSLPLTPNEIKKLQKIFPSQTANSALTPDISDDVPAEHLIWKQTPLAIILPVNKERMISFPETVSFGYNKNDLPESLLRVQNNNGTLYLLAKAPFASQRVAVRLGQTGNIILLDISAQKEADTTPVDIVIPKINSASTSSLQTQIRGAEEKQERNRNEGNTNEVILLRFAVQQLYAPKRLLMQPDNIYRAPMHTYKTVPLIRDGSVIAMPLASWRNKDLSVTAILLRNTLHQTFTVDPRLLCGSWKAVTIYPRTVLDAAGTLTDTTTVFVIANSSFSEALQSCLTGV